MGGAEVETELVTGQNETDAEPSDVERAARRFAAALAETPTYRAFEEASVRFSNDEHAREAYRAFQERQRELQPMIMLGAASEEQKAELDQMYEAFMSEHSASGLLDTQASLAALCSQLDVLLSQRLGLPFAATCSPGCCG
jgi:cell fate (sporulation/competence/biofilm development) regulator YlbF (YheA/YmcA/DUF963 family)